MGIIKKFFSRKLTISILNVVAVKLVVDLGLPADVTIAALATLGSVAVALITGQSYVDSKIDPEDLEAIRKKK